MSLLCCMNLTCRSTLSPHTWVMQWLLITQASTLFTCSSTRPGRKCGASEWPARRSILISNQPVTAEASSTAASAWGSTQTRTQTHAGKQYWVFFPPRFQVLLCLFPTSQKHYGYKNVNYNFPPESPNCPWIVCLAPSIPGIRSESTISLTTINWSLKIKIGNTGKRK